MNNKKPKQNILSQMFDVRPVDRSGVLDWERIGQVSKRVSAIPRPAPVAPKPKLSVPKHAPQPRPLRPVRCVPKSLPYRSEVVQLGRVLESDALPVFHTAKFAPRPAPVPQPKLTVPEPAFRPQPVPLAACQEPRLEMLRDSLRVQRLKEAPLRHSRRKPKREALAMVWRTAYALSRKYASAWAEKRRMIRGAVAAASNRRGFAFALALLLVVMGWKGTVLFEDGMKMKGQVLGVSQEGYDSLMTAAHDLKGRNFEHSARAFDRAYASFSEASSLFDEWNATLVDLSRFVPGLSKLSSGKNVVEAGKHVALAGKALNGTIQELSAVKNPLQPGATDNLSLLEVFRHTEKSVGVAAAELAAAQTALDKVKVEDIPEEKRDKFIKLKTQLPTIVEGMNGFVDHEHIFTELLGGNGPRKYLFLFQNNNEMRATGGFIGSYGLMDISDGRIRTFFVDGIFNPDGQLKEDIVPPNPLQKISAGWSMHDSNWFPDFPTSAEKAILFYEKTGGPTADGVMTLTPVMIQKLLALTGPIRMDKYDVTLDADNFLRETQREVEVDYDRAENKPKQILADLAPILLDKLLNHSDIRTLAGALAVLESGLSEKHVLLYSRDKEIQALLDKQGWSGRILDASKDYLSVINTNINGYKTDGVVDESIRHQAAIQEDGSIVDTVTITRKHNGGYTQQEWWNKVNADYMRVYVPKGSQLLSVEGQTREMVNPPLDYDKLGFKRDAEVEAEENSMTIDEATGTRIYEDAGKTVFGNWVYVSPQETATIKYSYVLPFRMDLKSKDGLDSYSAVYQKQSGSIGSHLEASVSFPSSFKPVWQSLDDLVSSEGDLKLKADLNVDRFLGVTFSPSEGN